MSTKRQAGRRAQVQPAELERLAAGGLTTAEIAECLGVGERTLYRYKGQDVELAEAIRRGRLSAHVRVSNSLFERCMAGDVTAIIWYEKSRRGLSDKVDVSPDELDEMIERELTRIAAATRDTAAP